jgi:predicted O-linked N-acetylglucosamine transferase (SPINDLY family)
VRSGFIAFGSFNNWAKVSPRAMRTWAKLLQAVPGSRLIVKSLVLGDESARTIARQCLAREGVPVDRVELLVPEPTHAGHLDAYRRVDIALDTFPYAGTTTTCEALAMGVPVVTHAGNSHAGRMGVSILTSTGLDRWVARDHEQYIQIAQHLAGDVEQIRQARSTLAEQIRRSPLCDADRLIRAIESAYRQMWKRWCEKR